MKKASNQEQAYKISDIESTRQKLEFISARLESWINDDPDRYKVLPEWPRVVESSDPAEILKKIKHPVGEEIRRILRESPFARYTSWEDFFEKRKRMIEDFSKKGRLDSFEVIPLNPDDDGAYTVLKRDCDDLLKVINICLATKDGALRFPILKDAFEYINRHFIYLHGRDREKEEMAPHKKRSEAIVGGGRRGAHKRWDKEKEKVKALHTGWQSAANRAWAKHPNWSKFDVARHIAKEPGGNADYIRRIIKKPAE